MRPSRREFLALIAVTGGSGPLLGRAPRRIQAVAFDAFVLFSPKPILERAHDIAGQMGDPLFAAASAKLFGYTWFETSAGRYVPFDELAADAFRSTAQSLGVRLSRPDLAWLVDGYSNLDIWPDVPHALLTLRRHGIRLAMLSNLSERALIANLRSTGIAGQFEQVLSTDGARRYKPSPKAYELAVRAFNAQREEIGFAASASWDAAGATWFGFPTVWVNRNALPGEPPHAQPKLVSNGMGGVIELAGLVTP